MKKSILDEQCCEALAARVQKIQPDSQPRWGTMNATEMLLHCNRVNEQLLAAEAPRVKTKVSQYIARLLVLYLLPNYPKGARTPRRLDTKGQIDVSAFRQEQTNFIDIIRRFPVHQKPIELPHPYFGQLSTKQWGLAGYKHVDHHLRQFGV